MGPVLALAFAAQILALTVTGVGVQGAHVQQPSDPGGAAGIHQYVHQLDVQAAKACRTAGIEDADQVDGGLAALKGAGQGLGVEDIDRQRLAARQ